MMKLQILLALLILPMLAIPAFAELQMTIDEREIGGIGTIFTIKVIEAIGTTNFIILSELGNIIDTFSFMPSSQGEITLPWMVPKSMPFGNYIFNVTDSVSSVEVIYVYGEVIVLPPITTETLYDMIMEQQNTIITLNNTITQTNKELGSYNETMITHNDMLTTHDEMLSIQNTIIFDLSNSITSLEDSQLVIQSTINYIIEFIDTLLDDPIGIPKIPLLD